MDGDDYLRVTLHRLPPWKLIICLGVVRLILVRWMLATEDSASAKR